MCRWLSPKLIQTLFPLELDMMFQCRRSKLSYPWRWCLSVPLCVLFILCAHLHGPASSGAASCASKALQLWRVGSGRLSMEIIRVGVNLMWAWTKLGLPGWTESYLLEFQNFDCWFDSCFRHNFRSLIWRENIFPTWLEAMSRAMQYDPHWEYFSSAEIVDDAQTCTHALIVNRICTCYCFL